MISRSFFTRTVLAGFFLIPALARADHNPDFADDARPILNLQPGLLQYVERTFQVRDSGIAKFPGNDNRRPMPPFIFTAKGKGEPGPYHLRLLIQPGPPGQILKVVDMNNVHLSPGTTPPPTHAPAPSTPVIGQSSAPQLEPQQPTSPSSPSAAPTSNTPSGPITSDTPSGPISNTSNLAPPPDPAPAQ